MVPSWFSTLFSARQIAWLTGFVLALSVAAGSPVMAQTGDASTLEARLRQRVAERPDDGSSWRMLGRHLLKQDRLTEAEQSLQQAVTLSPKSAAAYFDLGQTLKGLGEAEAAAEAYQTVIELAPDSEYAQSAQQSLTQLGPTNAVVLPVDFRIRRFDGSELTDRVAPLSEPEAPWWRDRLSVRLETGVLYNSNVALSPLSRELNSDTTQSLQGFFEPDVLFALWDKRAWRSGPTLRGHFTLNEGNFRQFDLQSYRPGWFTEFFVFRGDQVFVPRVAYEFTHDEFDGTTLGNRHAVLSSFTAYWNDVHSSLLFWSIDNSNFLDDGILPSVTSQDGWTNALGLSHDVALPHRYWRLVRGGIDISRADTTGSDYTFNGVSLFAAGVFPLAAGVELTLQGGWGYRDYPDFEFTPSRNEHIWRAGAELRKFFNKHVSVAIVCNYDRFDSKNPLFDSQRDVTGVVLDYYY